jgi:hypothetical protein
VVVACGDVAREGVVGGGLVGDDVGDVAALQECRKRLGCVAEDSYGQRLSGPFRLLGALYGSFEIVYPLVQVAVRDAAFDSVRIDLYAEGHALVHGYSERLGATHAAEACGQADAATQCSPKALFCHGRERLVSALKDALGADIDPRPRGHLTVHSQPGSLQFPKGLPVGPLGYEEGVSDQNPRRPGVCPEDGHRLS